MSSEQCWARQPDGTRCEATARGESFVCAAHTRDGIPPNPMSFFRAPEAQMPPALVDLIRRYAPGVIFPTGAPAAPAASAATAAAPAPPPVAPGPAAPDASATAPPAPQGEPASLDWLLAYLREAITGLMASEATPLQKANAVARLGSLYLKTAGAADLKRENKALTRRLAELQERATAAEARLADGEAFASVPTERHETIAAGPSEEPAPDCPSVPHASLERGASPHVVTPDHALDDPWDADDPSLAAAAPGPPP